MGNKLESSLEKIGRIIGQNYGLEVIFKGNMAYTDGKRIVLPSFQDLTPDLERELNAYLDHEAAHILFTTFDEMKYVLNSYHKTMFNLVEDTRIERLMFKKYEGTQRNLDFLNNRLIKSIRSNWPQMPWPNRLLLTIRDHMEHREMMPDSEVEYYMGHIIDLVEQLNDCETTTDLRVLTDKIVRRLQEIVKEELKDTLDRDDMKMSQESESGEGQESQEGEDSQDGQDGNADDKQAKDGKDGKEGIKGLDGQSESDKGSKSGDKGQDGETESEDGKESKDFEGNKKGEGSGEGEDGKGKKGKKSLKESDAAMITDTENDDVNVPDIHNYINEKIEEKIEEEGEGPRGYIPFSTEHDTVTDYSGKGDSQEYAKLRKKAKPASSKLRRTLDRVLKAKENARIVTERERGEINSRALCNLITNKSYRTPFKSTVKTETKNVAIQIHVDLSGSMGTKKMNIARETVAALSETLRELDISFCVTGFHSVYNEKLAHEANKTDTSRFSRFGEKLDHQIFKSYESTNLSGITKMESGCNNPDGESVRWAAKMLNDRREKRKILIVISDGYPEAEGRTSILDKDLKDAIKKIKKSNVEVVGIGIQSDAVAIYYPEYVVVNDLSCLTSTTLKQFSKILLKNARKNG